MKKSLYLILLMTIFVVGSAEVNASSGKLRSASIKTCGGITYGQHSSDDHWHIAKNTDNGWYPDGDAIYYNDLCSSNNNSSSDNQSNDSSSNNSSSSSSSNNSSSNNSSSGGSSNNNQTTTKPEETKSNDNTLKSIIINEENIKIEENMNYSTADKKLDIKVETNDSKATYEIKNNSNLSVGNNEIVIEVKAEDGTKQNYEIVIHKYTKVKDTISTILAFAMLGGIGYGIYYIVKKS